MTITVKYECGGCFKSEEWKRPQRRFISINGKGYGFGSYKTDDLESVAPDGWVAFDPYTGCTYCPECWASIEGVEAKDMRESL